MARRNGSTERRLPRLIWAVWLCAAWRTCVAAQDTDKSLAALSVSRARQLMWKGKHEQALEQVQAALTVAPHMVEAHHVYQDILADAVTTARARLRRAEERRRKAAALRKIKPASMPNRIYLPLVRDVEAKKKQLKKAVAAEAAMKAEYKRRMNAAPRSAEACYLYARVCDDVKEKEKLFKRALRLDPKLYWAHYALGFLYERLGRLKDSEREFRAALKIKPDWAEAYVGLGFLFLNHGKNREALENLQKACELDPANIDAHMNLGYLYRRVHHYDKAIAEFKRVLDIDPDNPWAQNNLGVCYYRQGLFSLAAKCYRRALDSERYDTPELAHLNMGFVYRRRRHYVLAAYHFRKATELKPDFAYAHSQLAQVLYHQKKYAEARKHVQIAQRLGLKVNPEFLKVLSQAGG